MGNGLNQGCGFFWLSPVAVLWRRLVFTMVAAVPPRFLPPQSWMFMIYSANHSPLRSSQTASASHCPSLWYDPGNSFSRVARS